MIVTMSLNEAVAPSRSVGLMAPKPKLNGINVPKVLFDEVREILEIEKEAFLAIGGDTKKTSMSDIVTAALRSYVRAWRRRHGLEKLQEIPAEGGARRQFIKQVGLSNLDRLRANLLEHDTEEDLGDDSDA
jgi:hypothetical protein